MGKSLPLLCSLRMFSKVLVNLQLDAVLFAGILPVILVFCERIFLMDFSEYSFTFYLLVMRST